VNGVDLQSDGAQALLENMAKLSISNDRQGLTDEQPTKVTDTVMRASEDKGTWIFSRVPQYT
jgi:hypothetical protein